MIEIEVAGTVRAEWGEGAVWWKGALYYVDIEGGVVHRYEPSRGDERSWEIGQRVGMVVPREKGGLVIGGDDGLYFLETETGGISKIGDPEEGKADNRFNDGKCSPDGRVFAGTISLVKKEGDAKLYRLDPDLSIHEAYGPVTNSNGIAWSGDGKVCYYIDTPSKEVKAFDYKDGELTGMRVVISTKGHAASPDGMTIDSEGNLWIAFCHGGCVRCYDPESGRELRKVELPCLETTSCAFGGDDLDDLYVTTGIHKTVVEEHGGRLFKVTGLGVRGVNALAFGG